MTTTTTTQSLSVQQRLDALLAKIPQDQRQSAAELLSKYGQRLFDLAVGDALDYLRRLMAGDLMAAAELDTRLSDDEFIARVKANSARWDAVAAYNQVRQDLANEILLRLAPPMASILAALVGL